MAYLDYYVILLWCLLWEMQVNFSVYANAIKTNKAPPYNYQL